MRDDSDLRGLFREAREADETSAPSYQELRGALLRIAIGRRPLLHRLAVPLAAALALVVALLVGPGGSEQRPREAVSPRASVLTLDEWIAPTDFLLETPGGELLDSTPAIGVGVPAFSIMGPSTHSKGT